MKKTMITMGISLVLGLGIAFAYEGTPLTPEISNSFQKEFSNAKNVNWQNKDSYSIASFTWNNQVLFAYYLANGRLNTVMHNIPSDNLPIMLLAQIKDNYAGYWITDLHESVTNGHSSYFITMENADKKLMMKSTSFNEWDLLKKVNKDYQQI
jgi:hypothetical protein